MFYGPREQSDSKCLNSNSNTVPKERYLRLLSKTVELELEIEELKEEINRLRLNQMEDYS